MTRKLFVLDTSVLLHDPDAIFKFEDNTVVIPNVVLQELDKIRKTTGIILFNKRCAVINLEKLITAGTLGQQKFNLNDCGGELILEWGENNKQLSDRGADLDIIAYAKYLKNSQQLPVVIVSKDRTLRNFSWLSGVNAQDYLFDREDGHYTGHRTIAAAEEDIAELYLKLPTKEVTGLKLAAASDKLLAQLDNLTPNECLTLVTESKEEIKCRYHQKSNTIKTIILPTKSNICGLKPLNEEQKFLRDLLLDPKIQLITVDGATGSGKTTWALAAAVHQCWTVPLYDQIIVTRNKVGIGKEEGFLPGGEAEKNKPWMEGIFSCLNELAKFHEGRNQEMFDEPYKLFTGEDNNGLVKIKSLNYVRGVTWKNTILILDEAQNMHPGEIKGGLTRLGKGSKGIILGDTAQIDKEVSAFLDEYSNGLSITTKTMRGWDGFGHLTLYISERSELSGEVGKRM